MFVQFTGGNGVFEGDEALISDNPAFGALTCDVRSTGTGDLEYETGGIYTLGEATLISVEEGIYFMNGYFVLTESQTIPLFSTSDVDETENSYVHGLGYKGAPAGVRLFTNQTAKIGLRMKGQVITADEDESLKDPANGFFNYNAPGADRLKIKPTLIQIPYRYTADYNTSITTYGEVTSDFIELMRMENGVTVWQKSNPIYNNLGDTMARRTFDESGSYTVRPFEATVLNHLRDDTYEIFCDTGVVFSSTDSTQTTTDSTQTTAGPSIKIGDVLKGNLSGASCTVTNVQPYTFTGSGADPFPNSDTVITVKMKVIASDGSEIQDGVRLFENDELTVDGSSPTQTITTIDSIVYRQDPDGVYGLGEGGDKDLLAVSVGPGKAYVYGYEHELLTSRTLDLEKGRDFESLNDFNVVTNIGNFVNVTFPEGTSKFGEWPSTFDLNAHPLVSFANSDLQSIEFPFQTEESAQGECIFWAPLKATEHDELWNSVLFIGADPDGTPAAACNDGSDGCFGEIRNTTVTGGTTGASYKVESMSGDSSVTGVKNNIRKIIFQDLYNEDYDFLTVEYILRNWTEENQLGGFTTRPTEAQVAASDAVKVYQIENGRVDGVTGSVRAQGIAWRWVPASATGFRIDSTLFVEEVHGTFTKQEDTGTLGDGVEATGGVIYQRNGNMTAYGSSVREVRNIEFVQQITSSTDYNDTLIGTYEVGDSVRQIKTIANQTFFATGTVIAVAQVSVGTSDTDCDKIRVWVEVDGSLNDIADRFLPSGTGVYDGTTVSNVGPIVKLESDGTECIEYNVAESIIMGQSDTGKVQQVIFRDPYVSNSEYTFNTEVLQYNPFFAGEHTGSSGAVADESQRDCKATVLSFNKTGEFPNLYVMNTQNVFMREFGCVFQQVHGSLTATDPSLARQGGAGIRSVSDKKTGFFIDMKETYGGFGTIADYLEGETVTQIKVDVNSTNYIEGKDYTIGSTVSQLLTDGTTATGEVVAWETRDTSDATDTSSSILTIRPAIDSPLFAVGTEQELVGRILSTTTPPDEPTGNEDGYPVGAAAIVTRVLGQGRLRQFTAKDGDEYFAHFYDVKMNEFKDLNNAPQSYEFKDVNNFYRADTDNERLVPVVNPLLFRTHPTDGIDAVGRTKINGTLNRAIFPLPVGTVARSVDKVDYRIQKAFPISFNTTSNATTVETGSPNVRFVGGTGTTNEVGGINLEHYLLILSNGDILDLSNATLRTNNSDSASDGSLSIDFGTTNVAGGSGTLIATLDVNPATIDNTAVLSDFRKKVFTNGTNTNLSVTKNKQTGNWETTVPRADIKQITEIKDSSGAVVTSFFNFDDGQSDNLYDHATLTLLPAHIENDVPQIAADGTSYAIDVSYTFFEHTGEGPLFVDSYTHSASNMTFDDVPVYVSKQTGDTYPLNTCVDCRPLRATDGTIKFVWLPKAGEAFDVSYSHFLGRFDKLIITDTGEFDVIRGIPSQFPVAPAKAEGTMDLYHIKVPPYTFKSDDVSLTYIENKRYTMRDIGGLEKRIEALEYYTSLSLLEKETEDLFIDDGSGNNRFKLGTLVDNFTGHDIGDVRNPDYNCAIDRQNNHLRCKFTSKSLDMVEDTSLVTSLVKTNDDMYHLPFSNQVLTYNPVVSTKFNLNPFDIIDWQGKINLNPSTDNWVDQKQAAKVRVNMIGENDNWDSMGPQAVGTDWNDWQTNWTGTTTTLEVDPAGPGRGFNRSFFGGVASTVARTTRTVEENQTRQGIQNTLVPDRVTRSLGNRVVDVSLAKFIRARAITFTAQGLKPNTTVYPYFDEVMVAEYCTVDGISAAQTGLTTDANGSVTGVFNIPAGKFLTGERVFKLIDDKNNQQQLVTTSAEADFQASGLVKTNQEVSITTRSLNFVRQSVTEERTNTETSSTSSRILVRPGFPGISIVGGGTVTGSGGGSGGGPGNIFNNNTGIRVPRRPGARPCPALSQGSANRLFGIRGGISACIPSRWRPQRRPWTPFRRGRHRRTGRPIRQRDPLAQTFFVSAEEHPDGVYITKLDLWFASKGDVPIDVQIRPVVNGYPHASAILPFGQEVINSSDVTAMGSAVPTILDSANATTVTFQTPIHLVAGQEYAIVLIANSTEYEIYGSTMGQSDLNSGDIISKQPTLGSLFKSQNSMTWEADQKSDIMYVLYHAEFDTTTTYDVVFTEDKTTTEYSGKCPYDLYNLNAKIAEHATAFADFSIARTNNTADASISDIFEPFIENENVKLSAPAKVELDDTEKTLRIKASMYTQNPDVSPILDMQQFGFIAVNNIIDNNNDTSTTSTSYNGELDAQGVLSTNVAATRSKYISRQVVLQEGFEANNLTVMLTENKPAGCDIQVFIKFQKAQDDRSFDKMPYVQLTKESADTIQQDETEFVDSTYKLATDTTEPFNKYAIKIVLYSGNSSSIPRVKDLRAISVL